MSWVCGFEINAWLGIGLEFELHDCLLVLFYFILQREFYCVIAAVTAH